MTGFIQIDNREREITATNYFESEHAARGLAYLTINAGALRLLVPPAQVLELLPELASVTRVVADFCERDNRIAGRRGIALWFDDGTESPYRLDIQSEQCDRWLTKEDDGRELELLLYTAGSVLWRRWPCLARRRAKDGGID